MTERRYGTSENAVKTQVWIAIAVYVLVAIIRKRLRLHFSLYTNLQILSIALFEKTPILQAFAQHQRQIKDPQPLKQLYGQGFFTGQQCLPVSI